MSGGIALPITDELLDQLADLLAPRVAERVGSTSSASDDEWVRGAENIGKYLGGAPKSRIYGLHSAGRIWPVETEGRTLVAKKSDLDRYVREGGANRP